MKQIYYIGFYNHPGGTKRSRSEKNLPGTMKMDFIIKSLKRLGYQVCVISLGYDDIPGYHPMECINIDDQETHVYLSYFSIRYKGKIKGAVVSLVRNLKSYLKKNVKGDSVIVSYHSLAYRMLLADLHDKIGFKWIVQIEELYSLSRKDYQDLSFRTAEEKMFADADGYLFVNDLLPARYAHGTPYAVSYGNYHIFSAQKPAVGDTVNVVYTGVINEDRGIFLLMEAMKHLPNRYVLNILGFGSDTNMTRFHKLLKELNEEFGKERIRFFGTRSGQAYTEFLSHQNIGVSLMGLEEAIAENAFPSKIMAYLGHSLFVVSSKSKSITQSKVAPYLYFCDNTPESVAEGIMMVPVDSSYDVSLVLKELENDFVKQLEAVVN